MAIHGNSCLRLLIFVNKICTTKQKFEFYFKMHVLYTVIETKKSAKPIIFHIRVWTGLGFYTNILLIKINVNSGNLD